MQGWLVVDSWVTKFTLKRMTLLADKVHEQEPQHKRLCLHNHPYGSSSGKVDATFYYYLYDEMVVGNVAISVVILVRALCQPMMSFFFNVNSANELHKTIHTSSDFWNNTRAEKCHYTLNKIM